MGCDPVTKQETWQLGIQVTILIMSDALFHSLDSSLSEPILYEDEWWGALVTCLIPFCLQNSWNSSPVNAVALSLIITSGNPWLLKEARSLLIVIAAVDPVDTWTSIPLENAYTITSSILPSMGPAYSICRRDHGHSGNTQGCRGATATHTCVTWFYCVFDVLIDARPPNQTAGHSFHPYYSWMPVVEVL